MVDPINEWNGIFARLGEEKPKYDAWLDKYGDILEYARDSQIIDLGCGFGNDTLYLYERGYDVISCDFSIEALKRVEKFIPNPKTRLFSILDGLPFESGSVKLIIADLSLHYFTWADTAGAVDEIRRVLKDGGYLLCRVNSVRDANYGAGQGVRVEENYYNVNGRLKRFFDRGQLEKLFTGWKVRHLEEYNMDRYSENKIVWEIAAEKPLYEE